MPNQARSAWSDQEKFAYLLSIIQSGAVNGHVVDWKKAPVPPGRTMRACQEMFRRLNNQVKDDTDGGGRAEELDPKPKRPIEEDTESPNKKKMKKSGLDEHEVTSVVKLEDEIA